MTIQRVRSTLGFIYTSDFEYVLLIRKQRPAHHAGKLNGLGGKFEIGEVARECISREVKEESTLEISPTQWKEMGVMHWQEWEVEMFATIYTGSLENIASLASEEVGWYSVTQLPDDVISNLRWLVPLGIDVLQNEVPPQLEVIYPKL